MRNILILGNILLILVAITFVLYYATDVRRDREDMERDTFTSTVETMKQISVRYLDTERQSAENWAAYIENQQMTMDEALAYIQASNTQEDRRAHIVDMDTYEAYSSAGGTVSCYQQFSTTDNKAMQRTIQNMQRMFDRDDGHTIVLGKYKIYESQINAISVGCRVRLKTEDGGFKPYLLLRIIPVESMKKIWIFPLECEL